MLSLSQARTGLQALCWPGWPSTTRPDLSALVGQCLDSRVRRRPWRFGGQERDGQAEPKCAAETRPRQGHQHRSGTPPGWGARPLRASTRTAGPPGSGWHPARRSYGAAEVDQGAGAHREHDSARKERCRRRLVRRSGQLLGGGGRPQLPVGGCGGSRHATPARSCPAPKCQPTAIEATLGLARWLRS